MNQSATEDYTKPDKADGQQPSCSPETILRNLVSAIHKKEKGLCMSRYRGAVRTRKLQAIDDAYKKCLKEANDFLANA